MDNTWSPAEWLILERGGKISMLQQYMLGPTEVLERKGGECVELEQKVL